MDVHCDRFRQLADSYLNSELVVETNHKIISHVGHCLDCSQELSARRKLRTRLRRAYTGAPENRLRPEFAHRLQEQLRNQALDQTTDSMISPSVLESFSAERRTSLLALAACLVLATAIGLVLILQPLVDPRRPRNTDVSKAIAPAGSVPTVNLVKAGLMSNAVGDHRDCAIHFRLAEKPIDLDLAGRQSDPVYINLTKSLSLPLDAQLVEAHSCVFDAHRFAHIVLKYHGHLVSLLVTASTSEFLPPGGSDSHVISCSQLNGYQVSSFQTRLHSVFVVSDMQEGENLNLTRALVPSVYAHIIRAESAA